MLVVIKDFEVLWPTFLLGGAYCGFLSLSFLWDSPLLCDLSSLDVKDWV
jgi:hypothetical protein